MNYAEEATNKEHVRETNDYTLIIHDPAVRKVKIGEQIDIFCDKEPNLNLTIQNEILLLNNVKTL